MADGWKVSLSYNTLLELVGAASMAHGYLSAQKSTPNQREIADRLLRAVRLAEREYELLDTLKEK